MVNWEHPGSSQEGTDYVHLLHAVRKSLPQPRFTITSALPAGEWVLRHINLYAAAQSLNFLNLMAYDFVGPWTDQTGHQAQLFPPPSPDPAAAPPLSGHAAVAYCRRHGVPSGKIILGVPVYGRSFLGATGIGQPYSGTGGSEEGTFRYCDLPLAGSVERVDAQVGAAYCVGEKGGFVTYDCPETVKMKAEYVRHERLGGLFYWEGTGDGVGGRSLVESGYNTLHGL